MENTIWNMWTNVHDNPDQKKRIESATKAACTPILLDQTTCTGKFKGSSGNHTTSLDKCSCVDFNRRHLPCKHMYRLAMELDLLDVPFKSDTSQIVEPQSSSRISLDKTVQIVEQLTIPQQKMLNEALDHINPKQPTCALLTSPDLQALIDSSILLPAPEIANSLSKYKKSELASLVDTLNIKLPVTVKKKDDIAAYLLDNYATQLFNMPLLYTSVTYNPAIKHGKLHMYLNRKFQYCYSYDDNSFFAYDTAPFADYIPNDDVTALLFKLGYFI